jgi:hypothetical protein
VGCRTNGLANGNSAAEFQGPGPGVVRLTLSPERRWLLEVLKQQGRHRRTGIDPKSFGPANNVVQMDIQSTGLHKGDTGAKEN